MHEDGTFHTRVNVTRKLNVLLTRSKAERTRRLIKEAWIKPRTTYCKEVDVFKSAVDESNQFNGEWFTQIQLTVKKEMSWINDGTQSSCHRLP